jgi:REP element-mobilizing transposase RayT
MNDHVHLLITTHEEQSIAKAIQLLGWNYGGTMGSSIDCQ